MRRGFLLKGTQKKSEATGTRSDEAADAAPNNGRHPNSRFARYVGYKKLPYNWEASYDTHTKNEYTTDDVLIAFRIPNPTAEPSTTEVIARAHIKGRSSIKHTGTAMGLGMFATRDLQLGDLILVERTLCLVDLAAWVPDHDVELLRAGRAHGLIPGSPSALNSIVRELLGIFNTNAYGISLFEDMGEKGLFAFVAKELSRINHSCVSNCMFVFDISSFAIYLRAGKIIKKGEQIFRSYHNLDDNTFAARKSFLQMFSINCTCPICSLPPYDLAACDAFRTSIESRIRDIEVALGPILPHRTGHRPAVPIVLEKNKALTLLDDAKFISREMERWGMEVSDSYWRVLNMVCTIYIELCVYEDSWQAKAQEAYRKLRLFGWY
ncbi:hypothetical protein BDQ17DRAFT_1430149 [Cyathus striatus]|nr:hypothetical protein BDQ17DRAFT_1430149 [Cyathus striatus]